MQYDSNTDSWNQVGDLGEGGGGRFGYSSAISSDGRIVASSAPLSDNSGPDSGQVRVYGTGDYTD